MIDENFFAGKNLINWVMTSKYNQVVIIENICKISKILLVDEISTGTRLQYHT